MTSPRQRPPRPPPPLSSREAALFGALTAFAKSPPTATGLAAQRSRPTPSLGTKPIHNNVHSGANASVSKNPSPPTRPPVTARNKPIRHDSGSVSSVTLADTADKKPIPTGVTDRTGNGLTHESLQLVNEAHTQKRQKSSQSILSKAIPAIAGRPSTPVTVLKLVAAEHRHDESPIPSTSSLVQLFEQKGTTTASIGRDTPLKSPKPVRHASVLQQDDLSVSSHLKSAKERNESDSSPTHPPLSDHSKAEWSSPNSFASARDSFSPVKARHRLSSDEQGLGLHHVKEIPFNSSISERIEPPRRSSHGTNATTSSPVPIPRALSAGRRRLSSTNPTPPRAEHSSPYTLQSAATSSASITATYNAMHPRRLSALKTGDSLANAIVASSLASTRASTPALLSVPPPTKLNPRRSHHTLFSRTPSPHKHKPTSAPIGMRHTLRTRKSSSSNSSADGDPYAKHKRKRHIHRHANKYHEGDRKRWRDVVTARERTRYEGVWAANRGVLINARTAEEEDQVHAYAVREIYSRSRLPAHVLEEIWALVAVDEITPRLGREEFVVGLWLIDQRLKGRKLPLKVSDSVWASVRVLKGIRIKYAKDKVKRGR